MERWVTIAMEFKHSFLEEEMHKVEEPHGPYKIHDRPPKIVLTANDC